MISKYGEAAVLAVGMGNHSGFTVQERWSAATEKMFPESISSQQKNCPRGAFLGMCEAGLVKGIPQGHYTRSKDNKGYALKAIDLLMGGGEYSTPLSLWKLVVNNRNISHNSQMDVVVALWEKGLIIHTKSN
jgi:hypothetical protein